jgi:Mechanosensitive ion channel, conserved TM helix
MDINTKLEPIRDIAKRVYEFLPNLAVALGWIVLFLVLARVARFAVRRGLRAINVNVVTERAGLDDFLKRGGLESDTIDIFALIVYWLLIVVGLLLAFDVLGLNTVRDLLKQIVQYVPQLAAALVILTLGAYFAMFVGNTISAYFRGIGTRDAELLGRLAQYVVIAFVVLMALEQLGLGGEIIKLSFLILLGGVVLALALAFGLGGQKWAANLLERWWPSGRD